MAKTSFKIGNSDYHAKYPCYWFLVLYDIEKCNIESEIDSFAEDLRLANIPMKTLLKIKYMRPNLKQRGFNEI